METSCASSAAEVSKSREQALHELNDYLTNYPVPERPN